MQTQADTVYNHNRPWQSNEERLTSDSLAYADVPAEQIRAIRPPVPQTLFRQPYGYAEYAQRQLRITDIGLVADMYPQVDYTGRVSGYSGSLRNGFPALNTF